MHGPINDVVVSSVQPYRCPSEITDARSPGSLLPRFPRFDGCGLRGKKVTRALVDGLLECPSLERRPCYTSDGHKRRDLPLPERSLTARHLHRVPTRPSRCCSQSSKMRFPLGSTFRCFNIHLRFSITETTSFKGKYTPSNIWKENPWLGKRRKCQYLQR